MTTVTEATEKMLGTMGEKKRQECDLVMKGGITSGIVYPKAVLALKDTYQFRNIGGTSAGAIAAAATAAAEYGRTTSDASGQDGFGRLGALNDALCERSFLRDLFQPSPKTRVLMEAASAAMKGVPDAPKAVRVAGKVGGVAGVLVRLTPLAVLLGAGAGLGIGTGLSALDAGTAKGIRRGLFLGLYGVLGGAVGGVGALLHKLFHDLPENGFGICNGHQAAGGPDGGKPVLIDWLIGQIEGIGGKDEWAMVADDLPGAGRRYRVPLTFGDLAARGITLKMMTTNISEELPYVLPFENHRFLFEEAKMREYFPGDTVDHLVAMRHLSERGRKPPPGFHFLPAADDLPIVVAMRMSLSFPLLLCAVPLWTLGGSAFKKFKQDADEMLTPDDLSKNWFSDGGLSSNFPIHFFDTWLPTRPTFGIDLTAYPPEAFGLDGNLRPQQFSETVPQGNSTGRATARLAADPAAAVYLPRANEHPPKTVNALPSLVSFLGAIISTMQNYRDNQQSQLPSYRERIVQVRLEKAEGGLNLDMPAETLMRIAEKGRDAGEKLLTDFDLDEHQWTRFFVVMGQLEAGLREMQACVAPISPEEAAKFDVSRLLLLQQQKGFPYGYAPSSEPAWANKADEWVKNVQKVLEEIENLMQNWPQPPVSGKHSLFSRKAPAPASNLRLMPQLYTPLSDGRTPSDGKAVTDEAAEI